MAAQELGREPPTPDEAVRRLKPTAEGVMAAQQLQRNRTAEEEPPAPVGTGDEAGLPPLPEEAAHYLRAVRQPAAGSEGRAEREGGNAPSAASARALERVAPSPTCAWSSRFG